MKDAQDNRDELAKVSVGLLYIQRQLLITNAALDGARQLLGQQSFNREADAILQLCSAQVLFAANFIGNRVVDLPPLGDAS